MHVGAQKTGTTSLQAYLAAHRPLLKNVGIVYPETGIYERPARKHQWLFVSLRTLDRAEFDRRLREVADECDARTDTIVLSTETLYSGWRFLNETAREWLASLRETYECSVWLWLREPHAFCVSFFVQTLRNAQYLTPVEFGRDRSVAEFLTSPWVAENFDYAGMVGAFETLFGRDAVYAFAYTPDIVALAKSLLALDIADPAPRENETALTQIGFDVLRVAGRVRLEPAQKEGAWKIASALSDLLGERSPPIALSPQDAAEVDRLCTMTPRQIVAASERSIARWLAYDAPRRARVAAEKL